ncbi:MAG TPA: pyridoxamine 5'-phosphate oxidase family protein [Candidatus Binatia bacterium]|jgi:predicted pyridoxine 5'-phosphate oxidase superfamily flavin-nucleotide-binding protein|nr:pyridoxamine 5'-phosphate oxidase family protein [Candidatus Binatia bacterium]
MSRTFLRLATTPAVLAAQDRTYGRARPVSGGAERDVLGPHEREYIAERDSFYMASVSESGWPYVQHRGGRPGFLHVLGPSTIGYADYEGNHQLLSTGNLTADDRVALILMDYPNQRRLKILGHARIEAAGTNAALVEQVAEASQRALVERVVVIEVTAFDWNCPKYITPRYTADEVREGVAPLRRRIEELEQELAHLRATTPTSS